MQKIKVLSEVMKVEKLIQIDDINAVNTMLKSKEWVLINSYYNSNFTSKKPIYTLGKVR